MAEIDPVILELRADLQSYNRKINDAHANTDKKLSAIEARSNRMGGAVSKSFGLAKVAAGGFIASLGVEAIFGAVRAGLDYASTLGEVAQQLGVTTDALQEYRYAGSQAGLATEEVDQALSQLTRRIGEGAQGTKAQSEAFEKLGVSLRDVNGNVISAGDAIPQIADALKKVESPAERAAILMDLFGRAGQKLEPLLAGGAAGVNGLRDAAQKLGLVLSSDQIAKADETADKLDAVKQVLSARIAGVVADNSEAILALADAFAALANGAGKAITLVNALYKVVANKPGNLFETVSGFNLDGKKLQTRQQGGEISASGQKQLADVFAKQKANRTKLERSNFAADQGSPFEQFAQSVNPSVAASAVLNPTKEQQAAIGKILSQGETELAGLYSELNSLAAELIGTAEARVAAEKLQIETDKAFAISRINANDSLSASEKELARLALEQIALGKIELLNVQATAAAAQEADELADLLNQAKVEALEDELQLATSNKERRRIAVAIVKAETDYALAKVDEQLLQDDISDAQRDKLNAIRSSIETEGKRGTDNAEKDTAGAIEQYRADLEKLNFGDELEKLSVDQLRDFSDELGNIIVQGGSLGDVLGSAFKQITAQLISMGIQLLIIKPLLESLGGGFGGGGGVGGLFASLGSLVGGRKYARGTNYAQGGLSLVGERGPEIVNLPRGAQVIPNNRINAQASSGGGGISVIRLELSGDIDARIQSTSAQVAVEIVRQSAPGIRDAAVNETIRRGQRPGFNR